MEFRVSRKKVFVYWLVITCVFSALASCVSVLNWEFSYVPEANVNWSPINDFLGMFLLMPFGFALSIFMPLGWFSLISLISALFLKDSRPLLISFISALIFGWYWPRWYVGLMGV